MICVNGEVKLIKITQSSASSAVAREVAAAVKEIRPEGKEIVVVAANHSVATQIARLAEVLIHEEQQTELLVEGMYVPSSTVSPAKALQAQRNAEARQELIEEFGLHESDHVAALAGSSANNRSATASRWLAAGRIFAVNHLGARVYPNFQFGTDGQPRPVIANVLDVFQPYGLDGWEIALWFTTASGWLDDERPVDLLTRHPEQIVEAAQHLFDEAVQ
jgi:hypothetical protein